MLENVRVNVKRGLPQAGEFKAHNRRLAIAGGGPSLQDTWKKLKNPKFDVAAVNGSLGFLLERKVTPWACGVVDSGEHMADIVPRHPDVWYFLSSTCNPKVYEKLEGCKIVQWHPTTPDSIIYEPGVELAVGGGVTMGLRWLNLGYLLGYRRFDLHGLDSSYRGSRTHAYSDRRDGGDYIEVDGWKTSMNFVQQVVSFFGIMDRLTQDDVDPIKVNLHGTGLLQSTWKKALKESRNDAACGVRELEELPGAG